MHQALVLLVVLLTLSALVALLAPRLKLPYPILLVLAGLGVSLSPLPPLRLDPDLILLLFLPPLLYADAFHTSWRDFRQWLRPIVQLAIGLVAATTLVVGLVARWCFPELPWAACFILGAIVSPTDTVAAQAVIERLRVPRRVTAILGGESLVNDATGLVGVQLGVAVVLTGVFDLASIASSFAWVAGGGVAVGLGVGAVFALANRRIADGAVLFVLSLLSPYVACLLALESGTSPVLAVVVAGFFVAWRIHQVPPESRVRLFGTWESLAYVLNGLCFLFIGIEAPRLLRELPALGWWPLVGGLLIALAVIALRVVWCFPGAYLPLLLHPRLRAHEGGIPSWRTVLLVGWCGMRGVVSLAAALALPLQTASGQPFPGRDLILFCTVVVIAVTLLLQGATLLPLIRLLGIPDEAQGEAELRRGREAMLAAGLARLDAFCTEVACPIAVHHLRHAMADRLESLKAEGGAQRELAAQRLAVSAEVREAVRAAQSAELLRMRDRSEINDRIAMELQLEIDRKGLAM